MFFGTAHEVAHSWWGGQLRGANAPGGAFLSEGLSNYSAMMVTEKEVGPAEARRVYEYQLDRYLSRRGAFQRDVPLIEVEDHPHIAYGKGAIVMYQLREQLGEQTVNDALRRFLERHRGNQPGPTASGLLAELRAVTPESEQYLLTDLFETITLWDVETRRAAVRRTSDGEYEVTLDVHAKKIRADAVGRETEVPMDDWVEIGVFDSADGDGSPLYLERHRIRGGDQTIRLTVSRAPASAGVDPRRTLIDREPGNNVVNVQSAAPATEPAGGQP
jgi:aminopeptidase N